MKKILALLIIIACCSGLGFVIHKRIQANYGAYQENELKRRAPIDIPDPSIVTIQEVEDNGKATIALFYVDWCGYCKRFMPHFGNVAKEFSDRFNFAVVHCEKEENQEMVKEFGIHGFPSLFIIDKKINYHFPLSSNVTIDENALKDELNKYLEVRKHFEK